MKLLFSLFNLCCTQKRDTERIPKHTFLFFSFHLEKKDEPVQELLPVHPKALPMGFCSELSAYRETL